MNKRIGSLSASVFASVLLLSACGEGDKVDSSLQDTSATVLSSESLVVASSSTSSIAQSSSASQQDSAYDASSMLGFKVGDKSVFPMSMTVSDYDDKNITVRVATKIGTEKPFDKKSLVVAINGDQVYLDQSGDDPYLFSLPVILAKSMLSSKPSIIRLHVEKDRYYEADFEMVFENSFRSSLDKLLKSI